MNKKKFKEMYSRIMRGENKNIKFTDAKSYQINEIRKIIEKYKLGGESDECE